MTSREVVGVLFAPDKKGLETLPSERKNRPDDLIPDKCCWDCDVRPACVEHLLGVADCRGSLRRSCSGEDVEI